LERLGEGKFREVGTNRGDCSAECGGILDRELSEAGGKVVGGRDELAEGLGAEDEAGRDREAGLGEPCEVGALAAGFGDLRGEPVAEEEDIGHGTVLRFLLKDCVKSAPPALAIGLAPCSK